MSKDNESSSKSSSVLDRGGGFFGLERLGFFNPYLDIKNFLLGEVVEKGGKIYYRLVYIFLKVVRDYIATTSTR